ncbi:cytochrome c oxidase assembly protein [Endozoicomonas sp. SM1973]|uniref:Cytochrome c oxidase assembly protein CtaG n=1 Tax=Spartinivicinus marinus TaxID=2994442 RepID=A0A853I3K9_9GAMM|nr:cytochrome c oxidase assembly protein [Spartinivicinus marinus]MCX4026707.1 cytochrome c oxidase assembly protein [Spartinivicinus marinus]NYZ64541.1 cytochrome c oxidase assembly protein [Spartinivicinus marinus]
MKVAQRAIQKTAIKLSLIVVGMFGFGFAMVPLYDVFCEVTGLNGKTNSEAYQYQSTSTVVDKSRQITVQFITNLGEGAQWEFKPIVSQVKVHPGQLKSVEFFAKNPTNTTRSSQAVPSISPTEGTIFLQKTECFCFEQQTLQAGEEVVMPMRFVIDQEIPKHIKKLTLSYTLFDVTDNSTKKVATNMDS